MAKSKSPVVFEPPIEMDLGSNPGVVRFRDPSAFQEWLVTDVNFWAELDINLTPRALNASDELRGLRNAVPEAIRRRNETKLQGAANVSTVTDHAQIEKILRAYADGKVIHCQSEIAGHMANLAERKSLVELAHYYIATSPDGFEITNSARSSVIDLVQFQHASSHLEIYRGSMGKEFAAKMNNFLKEWQTRYNELLADHLKTVQAAKKLNEFWDRKGEIEQEIESLSGDLERRVSEALAPHEARVETVIKNAESKVTKAQTAFNAASTEMSDKFLLQIGDIENQTTEQVESIIQSVKDHRDFKVSKRFWSNKRIRHFIACVVFGIVFIVGIAAGIGGLVYYGSDYLVLIGVFDVAHQPVKTEFNVPLALFATLPAIGAFWILRQILKLFLVNLAQHSDASERIAMTETFLALGSEGKLSPEDRILIMQALFRPGPGSGDSDGGMPASWFDILLKRLEPPKA